MLQTLFVIVQIELGDVKLLYASLPSQIGSSRLQLRNYLSDTLCRQRPIRRYI